MKKYVFLTACISLAVLVSIGAFAQSGIKKKRPLPQDYGKVVLNTYSEKAGLAGVVFNHWLHRSKFTCRVCHVDIGFGMKAGSTGIRAADIMKGYYCGACHKAGGKAKFEACAKVTNNDFPKRCDRCHSLGKVVAFENDFATYTAKFPKERYGSGIDWEKAEVEGYIKLTDFVEGVSMKKPLLTQNKELELLPKVEGMPDIIFSHKKHTVWNGCAVCHPDIFVGVKKGATKYSMVEIFEGKYCGACHGNVAFPLLDCQRCHTKPVS
ncbi:MAG TPA: c(7)-type cytochrome triheme domain-containing protein [Nitrospirota bacterium]|nr:c(7)-type cytochrome triheme domain-containing protein [Nitrospirota bacterium]